MSKEDNESEASASASHRAASSLFSSIVALSEEKEEAKRCDTNVNVSLLSSFSFDVNANVVESRILITKSIDEFMI